MELQVTTNVSDVYIASHGPYIKISLASKEVNYAFYKKHYNPEASFNFVPDLHGNLQLEFTNPTSETVTQLKLNGVDVDQFVKHYVIGKFLDMGFTIHFREWLEI